MQRELTARRLERALADRLIEQDLRQPEFEAFAKRGNLAGTALRALGHHPAALAKRRHRRAIG